MSEAFNLADWPDLILQINTSSPAEGRVRFAFCGVSQGIQVHEFGFCDIVEPTKYIKDIIATLNQWADPRLSEDKQAISTHLDGIGVWLFDDLIPSDLKEYYWSDLHPHDGARVLLILNDLAGVIPWEVVKPRRENGVEAPFWCENLSMARWFPDYPLVESLPGTPPACVLGDPRLHDVSRPVEKLLGLSREQVIETWSDLLALLSSDGVGLLNWTGHGFANPKNPSLNSLPIGGETFRPLDILPAKNRGFAQTGPWVFLHACSSGQTGQTFVGLGGWPADLIDAGAGAVLATAWDVRDSTGIRFVETLYPLLLEGFPVGDVVRQARKVARCEDDPSWLAYRLYAHPGARIVRDRRQPAQATWTVRQFLQHAFGGKSSEDMSWRHNYLEWIVQHPHYTNARRLVPLEGRGLLDYTAIYIEGDQQNAQVFFQHFKDIAEAIHQFKAIVLLGDAGAGKTATLYRLLSDLAQRGLDGEYSALTPIYVSLDEFKSSDLPVDYVRAHCRDASLKDRLETELLEGRICLLCDALNEMPRSDESDYFRKVRTWRDFVTTYAGNLFVFACRTCEYNGELHLQTIEIRPLDDERILRYLSKNLESRADDMWTSLQRSNLVDLARVPLFLEWLKGSYVASDGHLPRNQGLLFKRLVDTLVQRELEKGLSESFDTGLLNHVLAEFAHLVHDRFKEKALPRDQVLRAFFETLSSADDPVDLSENLLEFAVTVGLLSDTDDKIRFSRAQFREYFAALALESRFQRGEDLSQYWRAPRLSREIPQVKVLEKWTALPNPPTTGWEEPTILTAGLMTDIKPLIAAICPANPLLAGRCIAGSDSLVPTEATELVQQALAHEISDTRVHLRIRVAAGHVLGRLGDPRLRVARDPVGVEYISPPLVKVPAGSVWLGSDKRDAKAFDDERPRHRIDVPAFHIERYPVTNAEYRCFIQAGGYKEGRYWTDAGWRWRQSEDTGEGSIARTLRNLAYLREHLYDLERWFRESNLPEEERDLWITLVRLDENQAQEVLLDMGLLKLRSHEQPAYWDDLRYNGANQPVVGVNWYEAMAYCSWLSEVLSQPVSLPTEVQWERAAKGSKKWAYPWGPRWASGKCNALPERILRPTPVGIFPHGRSPFGCDDMVGNVFEWTFSLYRPYPYDPLDGREDLDTGGVRVNRGGGWDSTPRVTRCALRGDMCDPATYDHNLGLRIVLNSSNDH